MPDSILKFFAEFSTLFDQYILGPVSDIGIVDIIDILILSIVIFYVYRFIRERRAGRLAIGLFLVIAVLIITTIFNMRAMKFILQNFYQVGMIAIIVIFQTDLRAALERFGTTPIRNFKSVSASDYKAIVDAADILSEAADALARTKTGALIAIERDTRLGEHFNQGVIVNADMSALLLRNIFVNKAPLHDGAVIIRDRRIYAAGCYLPLSGADVNKDLGTRHRAALGLSEVSDAVVIVVSEETGTISVAIDGNLTRNFNYGSLKQFLLKYLLPSDGPVKKISREAAGAAKRVWHRDTDASERGTDIPRNADPAGKDGDKK